MQNQGVPAFFHFCEETAKTKKSLIFSSKFSVCQRNSGLMPSAFRADGLLIKISKKIAVLLMKMPSLPIAEKIKPKTLLTYKAVVTLLIRSFFDNGGLFANRTYTLSCYIIAVQEVVALKNQKYHLYLSDDEYRQTIDFKKFPIFQSKYWTHFAYILLKLVPLKPEATAIFARFPGLPSNLKFWLHKPSHSLSSFGDTILLCPLLNEHRIIASKYR